MQLIFHRELSRFVYWRYHVWFLSEMSISKVDTVVRMPTFWEFLNFSNCNDGLLWLVIHADAAVRDDWITSSVKLIKCNNSQCALATSDPVNNWRQNLFQYCLMRIQLKLRRLSLIIYLLLIFYNCFFLHMQWFYLI